MAQVVHQGVDGLERHRLLLEAAAAEDHSGIGVDQIVEETLRQRALARARRPMHEDEVGRAGADQLPGASQLVLLGDAADERHRLSRGNSHGDSSL